MSIPTVLRGPRTFGILSIIFGGLVFIGAESNLENLFNNGAASDLARVKLFVNVSLTAMSLWLLAIGIGQLRSRPSPLTRTTILSVLGIMVATGIPMVMITFVVTNNILSFVAFTSALVLLPFPLLQLPKRDIGVGVRRLPPTLSA